MRGPGFPKDSPYQMAVNLQSEENAMSAIKGPAAWQSFIISKFPSSSPPLPLLSLNKTPHDQMPDIWNCQLFSLSPRLTSIWPGLVWSEGLVCLLWGWLDDNFITSHLPFVFWHLRMLRRSKM